MSEFVASFCYFILRTRSAASSQEEPGLSLEKGAA